MAVQGCGRIADGPWELMVSADRATDLGWAERLAARLSPQGIAVRCVCHESEAFCMVRRGHLKLAVLDTLAPRLSGLNLLRRIRSIDRELPCVLVSPEVDGRYMRAALDLRAHSVLTRPVDETILRDLIAAVFRRFYESELLF